MNKYFPLLILCLLSGCASKNNSAQQETSHIDKPNILFIMVDDMKPLLGKYKENAIQTPNIDKLADSGWLFSNAHCQVPICGASRASLLTGLYPDHSKVWLFEKIRAANPEIVTLPQHFKNNGYTTINVGKIFDYRTVDKFSDSLSWDKVFPVSEEDYAPHYSKETGVAATYYYQDPEVKKKSEAYMAEAKQLGEKNEIGYSVKRLLPATECIDVPDDAYKDGIFSKLAVKEMDSLAKQNQTFFLGVGFHKPHLPFVAPKKYWDLYEREAIPLPENPNRINDSIEYAYHKNGELANYTDEEGNRIYDFLKEGGQLNEEETKKLIHGYWASISYIDAQVGNVIEALERNNLADNTIIVFLGDHGFHLGDHNLWHKHTIFEQATRVPMIIKVPNGMPKEIKSASEFTSIYPTLCELAKLAMPEHLEGESLVKTMRTMKKETTYAFSQYQRGDRMGYAIRDDRYRYVEWITKGPHVASDVDFMNVSSKQFFDYQEDPHETTNFANQAAYETQQQRLANQLHLFFEGMRED